MSRITLNDLAATRTLDRDTMSRTGGGLSWLNTPGVYRIRPVRRLVCSLYRTRFGLRRYCFYR